MTPSPWFTRLAAPLLAAAALAACAQPAPSPAPMPPPLRAAPADVLGALPASLPGHQRHVVHLPPLDNEHLHRAELLGGKTLTVDCNRQGMDGHFAPREVPGRGYPYWVFTSNGNVMSTRMACPPGSNRQQFVSAETLLVPYNSRVPLVVFVPDGFEFKWRPFDTRAAGLPVPAR
ncbi:ecotin family protein [Ottowia testudinis]|uniref:Ecotin family protein n=1 Tax=Ottowia testudinis TaxID=2816950 RepID=A0A975CLG3_9BURK|nr:ecotin family protein [Ottowia testudinis]QTD45658.1 ecotin family protein [Ottowia testudinis]